MTDMSPLRRLVRTFLFAPVAAFALGLTGCGGTDQSTGVVAPSASIEEANKKMEDFMKGQTKTKGARK